MYCILFIKCTNNCRKFNKKFKKKKKKKVLHKKKIRHNSIVIHTNFNYNDQTTANFFVCTFFSKMALSWPKCNIFDFCQPPPPCLKILH